MLARGLSARQAFFTRAIHSRRLRSSGVERMNPETERALAELDLRLRAVLPEAYQDYDAVAPVSMGSAGLKYDRDGKVAWNEMWATFCDLAMAGGPPHKGTLLSPASAAEIDANRQRYDEVVAEICRGIRLVTGLDPSASDTPGWICVPCLDPTAADWLLRAVVMENVAARRDGRFLDVPAGPAFRLEKEIKNVVTVMAKTCHYWEGHITPAQQNAIGALFEAMASRAPLAVPALPTDPVGEAACREAAAAMGQRLQSRLGLSPAAGDRPGWVGVECPNIRSAVWLMRALVVTNVLARREGTALCLPVDPASDPSGARVLDALGHVHALAVARRVF